jgi:hypothetical protein
MSLTLATIQSYLDARETVTAFHMRLNPQCVHSGPLDLHMLAAKLGPDFNIPANHAALMRKLRCTRCGTKGTGMSIIIRPPDKG